MCITGALSSFACGSYLMAFTHNVFRTNQDVKILDLYNDVYCEEFPKWYNLERIMSTIELACVSLGLIISYCFLIYKIKKYFRDHMILEVKSLSILFASFMLAYTLRTFYQMWLGQYKNLAFLSNPYVRWWIMNYLWIIWDIVSIISILILHHVNFREKKYEDIVDPPSRNNSTFMDVNSETQKGKGGSIVYTSSKDMKTRMSSSKDVDRYSMPTFNKGGGPYSPSETIDDPDSTQKIGDSSVDSFTMGRKSKKALMDYSNQRETKKNVRNQMNIERDSDSDFNGPKLYIPPGGTTEDSELTENTDNAYGDKYATKLFYKVGQ